MKVRLTEDMLRVRLDRSDVDALSSSGSVDFALSLGSGATIRCTLRVDAVADTIHATLTGNEVAVILPADQAHRWIASDTIGLEGQVTGEPATHILVEKDLGCRHTDDASETGAPQTFDHLRA
jgi:hypothetical protein